jgi:dienelactone hydrolase
VIKLALGAGEQTICGALPGVDPERVATFGSSLGGGNALAAAAEDPRIAAAVSQVPFLDRDSQTYRGHPEVAEEMLAVAREGGYLPAVGRPHEAASCSRRRGGLASRRDHRRRLALAQPLLSGLAARSAP